MIERAIISMLGPLASEIATKVSSGSSVKREDRNFLLLYSMASDIKELRHDFNGLKEGIHDLRESVNQLRVDIARLNGKLGVD